MRHSRGIRNNCVIYLRRPHCVGATNWTSLEMEEARSLLLLTPLIILLLSQHPSVELSRLQFELESNKKLNAIIEAEPWCWAVPFPSLQHLIPSLF